MFTLWKKSALGLALAFAISAPAFADDIIASAASAGNLNTLAKALKDTGLADKLKGAGPYTVFAPTDEAFAKLPKAKLDKLLKDKAELTKVLSYHLYAGKLTSADVAAGHVKSVEGSDLKISVTDGVKVDDVAVNVANDIVADNGTIHLIDKILMPKK